MSMTLPKYSLTHTHYHTFTHANIRTYIYIYILHIYVYNTVLFLEFSYTFVYRLIPCNSPDTGKNTLVLMKYKKVILFSIA